MGNPLISLSALIGQILLQVLHFLGHSRSQYFNGLSLLVGDVFHRVANMQQLFVSILGPVLDFIPTSGLFCLDLSAVAFLDLEHLGLDCPIHVLLHVVNAIDLVPESGHSVLQLQVLLFIGVGVLGQALRELAQLFLDLLLPLHFLPVEGFAEVIEPLVKLVRVKVHPV